MKDIHGVKQYTIYGLADPDTQEIRYIGRTTTALSLRLAHHVTAARAGNKQLVTVWIRSLLSANKRPQIIILQQEHCRKAQAIKMERHYIKQYKRGGAHLLNTAPAY